MIGTVAVRSTYCHVPQFRWAYFQPALSIAESSQSVSSPPVGYSWLDISASTYAGTVVDEKTAIVDAGGCLCREMTSTEWSVANAPTWMHLKPIMGSELQASDNTQSADASTAGHGSTSRAEWAEYWRLLRTFTGSMDPYDVLGTWPTKPNDGNTAYDQYFDPISDLIARARRGNTRRAPCTRARCTSATAAATTHLPRCDRRPGSSPSRRAQRSAASACRGRQVVIAHLVMARRPPDSQPIVADQQPRRCRQYRDADASRPVDDGGDRLFLGGGERCDNGSRAPDQRIGRAICDDRQGCISRRHLCSSQLWGVAG